MSESLGYRRVGAAVLRDDHDIEPPATADELPAPSEFKDVHAALAVARVCPVVLRTVESPGAEDSALTEHGWSGQSVKWGLGRYPDPKAQSLQRLTEREMAPLRRHLSQAGEHVRWVSVAESAFFEAAQHPEVDR